ncbi:Cubilin-like protein [Aphelenchoides fujianensis]|nr:Cubilin-like protein [Aphelenchoides fujianensis]
MRFFILLLFFFLLLHPVVSQLLMCSRYAPRCHSNGFCGYDGKCRCWHGFAGYYCEDRDFCADQPCANGGTCDVWFGNFRCVCPKGFHGPQCEHKANPKAVQQANEQDVWETIFDLRPTGATTAAKINCFFSSARWFRETFGITFRVYVDADSRPMVFGWEDGRRRQMDVELPPDALEFTRPYVAEDFHTIGQIFTTYYDFFDGYNVTDLPWYVGHSPANPHWNKRVSAFIYMSMKGCKPKNQSHTCPTSYLQAFDQAKSMSGTWYKDHSFDIKVRPNPSAVCAAPRSWSGLWFFLWLVSTLGVFLGAWTAAPRYSPQVNGHLRQLWSRVKNVKGGNNATVELNEMLLQNNGARR